MNTQSNINNESPKKIKVLKFNAELGFTTTAERSRLMQRIKSSQTKPEKVFRKELWKAGIRYRINYKKLPGTPDIVINKKKLVIFVDGEFWHGYNWEEKRERIKTNRDFWIPKIERNMQRDIENDEALKSLGYTVLRFWENAIKHDIHGCVQKVLLSIGK